MPPAAATTLPDSVIGTRIASEKLSWDNRLSLLPHRPNFLLPFAWSPDLAGGAAPGPLQPTEVSFQLSFKMPLMRPVQDGRWAAYFAYTGQYWWQAYNTERSSPFREYNHAPELFVTWPLAQAIGPWTLRTASLGFEHHSNGRAGITSRSWNRVFADLQLDHPGGWWFAVRPWVRVPERNKDAADTADGDDNPQISRYYGNGELRFGRIGDDWSWNAMLRRSLREGGKGAAELNFAVPTGFNPRVRWYLRLFDGYGESLIDYDRRIRRIGFGLLFNDWY